ncbi:Cytochrome bo(3) ubiquinol oxidase subunit 2,partial [Serratia symbiotica]|nr:Cytochrome bo(3) ubiquinol oxidase subunit 2,partial [Serratia symbiotica]
MRLSKINKSISILFFSLIISILSSCDNIILMHSKGVIGIEQWKLIVIAIILMLIIVVPVICLVLIFSWKYRSSNKNSEYYPNWDHSNKIEIVTWSIPIIIISILGVITWKTTHELDPFKSITSNAKPIIIEVISLDWKWLFIYPEYGIAVVNELVIPKNIPIEFKITSNSVMNSFFIPQLGGQIYAMAGMQTKLHLMGNEEGKYNGISSSYSGRGFSGMKFKAIVTGNINNFNKWIKKVKLSHNNLNHINNFNVLALPSENSPVIYFSSVKKDLFHEILMKFMNNNDIYNKFCKH